MLACASSISYLPCDRRKGSPICPCHCKTCPSCPHHSCSSRSSTYLTEPSKERLDTTKSWLCQEGGVYPPQQNGYPGNRSNSSGAYVILLRLVIFWSMPKKWKRSLLRTGERPEVFCASVFERLPRPRDVSQGFWSVGRKMMLRMQGIFRGLLCLWAMFGRGGISGPQDASQSLLCLVVRTQEDVEGARHIPGPPMLWRCGTEGSVGLGGHPRAFCASKSGCREIVQVRDASRDLPCLVGRAGRAKSHPETSCGSGEGPQGMPLELGP